MYTQSMREKERLKEKEEQQQQQQQQPQQPQPPMASVAQPVPKEPEASPVNAATPAQNKVPCHHRLFYDIKSINDFIDFQTQVPAASGTLTKTALLESLKSGQVPPAIATLVSSLLTSNQQQQQQQPQQLIRVKETTFLLVQPSI